MALSKKIIAGGIAVLAVLGTAGAAMAAPAYATSNVNVRSGPGTGYGIVDALRRGEQVDVEYCQGSWCYVEKQGPDGWVSASYLDRAGGGYRPPVYQPPVYQPPVVRPPVYDPPYWGNPRPPRPPHWNPRPPRPSYPQPYPGNGGSSVCFNGPNGYFCVGD